MDEATTRNVGTFGVDANGKAASGLNHEGERTDATPRDGAPRSSEEVRESGRSEGGACSEAKFVGSFAKVASGRAARSRFLRVPRTRKVLAEWQDKRPRTK